MQESGHAGSAALLPPASQRPGRARQEWILPAGQLPSGSRGTGSLLAIFALPNYVAS